MIELNLGKVVGAGGSGLSNIFAFDIREDGHLYIMCEDENNSNIYNFFIDNTDGHLKYKIYGNDNNIVDLGLVVTGINETDGILTTSGGTMNGKLVANNTSNSEQQVRNIIFSPSVPTTIEDGCIVMVYE